MSTPARVITMLCFNQTVGFPCQMLLSCQMSDSLVKLKSRISLSISIELSDSLVKCRTRTGEYSGSASGAATLASEVYLKDRTY